jgi:hypothetical protein
MQRFEEVRTVEDDTAVTPVNRTARVDTPGVLAARIVWFIAGVIIALLALRFIFILLGANQGNGFVDFIYGLSYPFAAPFFGIFNYQVAYGVSRVEISSLVAIVIYALVAYGVARLLTIRRAPVVE